MSEKLFKSDNKIETSNSYTIRQIDENLISTYNKMKSIKEQVEDIKSQWKSLQEDVEGFSFAKAVYEGASIRESFQKAIDDLKLEYEDTKSTYNYYKELKHKVLTEAETIIAPNDAIDIDVPYSIKETPISSQFNSNSIENNAISSYTDVEEELAEIIDKEDTEDILQYLFNELVPDSGKADTFAGELVRAIMDLIYNYKQNKYFFYEGDGLERCGSSAQYLIDHGYEDDFAEIIKNIYSIDSSEYENILISIADKIIRDINDNSHYFSERNDIDSRQYNYTDIKEISPIYEYIVEIPENIQELYDDQFNIYDILRYIKDTFDEDGINVTISDIYDSKAGSLSILDVTRDNLDQLKGIFEDSKFWEDYYNDLTSDLEEDLQILHNTLNECDDSYGGLVDIFMQYHEDSNNYRNNPDSYNQVYEILDQYGSEDEDVDILFLRATEEEQKEMIDLIRPKDEYLN